MKKRMVSIALLIVMLLSWCTIPVKAEYTNTHYEIQVCAVGDNLMHSRCIKAGLQADGTRDYMYFYRYFKDYLKNYDINVVNQETVFVEDDKDFSGYPLFGGPEEVGLALMDAGFNMVTTATNHVMDKGEEALKYSHHFWTDWGIEPVGTYTNRTFYDATTGKYTENRGCYIWRDYIKIGMLNYTYGTNGMSLPDGNEWMVGTLYSKDLIKSEMEYAKSHCDVLIVFPHWGTEYRLTPDESQKEWAQFFADNGADVIIGTHPHVVEPLEYIKSKDGREVSCYYSLGNFISNQDEVPRMLGAAATFTVTKDGDNVELSDFKAVPLVTHITCYSDNFWSKQLWDYTAEEESDHRMRRIKGDDFSIDNLWDIWYGVFTEQQTGRFD